MSLLYVRTPLFSCITVGHKPELGPKPICHDFVYRDTINILFPSSCYNPPEKLINILVSRFTNKSNREVKKISS